VITKNQERGVEIISSSRRVAGRLSSAVHPMLSPIDGSGQGAASSIQDAALPPSQEEVPLSVGAVWDHIKEIKRASLIEAAAESERNLKSEHQVHEVQLAITRLQSEIDSAPSRSDIVLENRKLRSDISRVVEEQVRALPLLNTQAENRRPHPHRSTLIHSVRTEPSRR
jgi:hypothetical protein